MVNTLERAKVTKKTAKCPKNVKETLVVWKFFTLRSSFYILIGIFALVFKIEEDIFYFSDVIKTKSKY